MTTYKISDAFLDDVDILIAAVLDVNTHSDTLANSGVTISDMKKFKYIKEVAYQLCDRMSDGFDEIHDEK